MKFLIVALVLCASLVFGEDENIKPKAVQINAVEQEGIDDMFIDIFNSLEDVYEHGAGCQGRMQLLVAYLKAKPSTSTLNWVVSEQSCGFYHNADTYAYFEVTYNGAKYTVKMAGY